MMHSFFKLSREAEALFSPEVAARYWDWDAPGEGGKPGPSLQRSAMLRVLSSKILNVVGNSVAGQHDMQQLVPSLVQLGARHGAYGVREEHFTLLGKALMHTLREVLGEEDFPPEVERAWSTVYGFVSATMLGGALGAVRAAEPTPREEAAPRAELPHKSAPALPPPWAAQARGAPTLLQHLHGSAQEGKPLDMETAA
mmetsp:Transcript_89534/g.280212  ORF Transcript_89534/g.280212 Transcript_89534/m.280212 type:complete len:198 (-) Transcript_89534:162-755(-)